MVVDCSVGGQEEGWRLGCSVSGLLGLQACFLAWDRKR